MTENTNGHTPLPGRRRAQGYAALALLLLLLAIVPAVVRRVAHHDRTPSVEDSLFALEVQHLSDSLKTLSAAAYEARTHRPSRQHHAQGETSARIASHPRDTAAYRHLRPKREVLHFDLNTADSLDLVQLHGIGPVFARRILRYRQLLGGYASVEQLKEVYGMSPETYGSIAPHLSASPSAVRGLNVNSATIEQLRRHPYLDYYQARAIVAWREKGHHYNNLDDLRLVTLLDDSTLSRLAPYLAY